MTAPVRFTQADVERATKGVLAAKLPVSVVRISAVDGSIEVLIGEPQKVQARDEWADLN